MCNKSSVSVICPVKNEENRILDLFLESIVPHFDEVLIIDMGSSDRSKEIVRESGATLLEYDFSLGNLNEAAKQFGINSSRNDWVLIADADFIFTSEFFEEVYKIVHESPFDGMYVVFHDMLFGKVLKKVRLKKQLRLFKKNKFSFQLELNHSDPVGEGFLSTMQTEFIHWGHPGLETLLVAMNKYTTEDAHLISARNSFNFSIYRYFVMMVLKPLKYFFVFYLKERYYQEGFHGLAFSIVYAFNFFVIGFKSFELSFIKNTSWDYRDSARKLFKSSTSE